MAGSPRNSLGNVRSDMDIPYPEHLSRLNRHLALTVIKTHNRSRRNNRPRNRYYTQPVTFGEIQEVDEENSPEIQDLDDSPVAASSSTSNLESEGRFPNVLGSKRKKSKPLDADKKAGDIANCVNSNREALIQQKSITQLRSFDRPREGSI